MTVQELKDKGYLVKIKHFRYPYDPLVEYLNLPKGSVGVRPLAPEREIYGPRRYPRGGLTTMEVTSPDGFNYAASAECSLMDGFERKRGVRICLGRIIQCINEKIIV